MESEAKSSSPLAGPRWATRTLATLVCFIVSVLGITTLNGYAASGFTLTARQIVTFPFREIFGSVLSPVPKPPAGYIAATPYQLQTDFQTRKNSYLGQNVAVYGKMLAWQDKGGNEGIKEDPEAPKVPPIHSRPGTITLALYVDPTEHPEMSARPVTITVRISEDWKKEHAGIQGQWVQAIGTVVPYAPGGGEATPEIAAKDIISITEPADIYDHNLPAPNPLSEHD